MLRHDRWPRPVPRHARMRRGALLVLVVLAAVSPQAHANSDPASDTLLSQQLFLPVSTPISSSLAARLASTVGDANAHGYEIRVAVVAARADLGGVPALWLKPKEYARFLAEELRSAYSGRLVVAMPNGFGFFAANGPSATEQRLLDGLTAGRSPNALVRSTIDAVPRLETAAGTSTEPHGGSGSSAALIAALVSGGALVAAAIVAWLWTRRRGAPG